MREVKREGKKVIIGDNERNKHLMDWGSVE